MRLIEKLKSIDEFLAQEQNFLSGDEGEICAQSRAHISEIKKDVEDIQKLLNEMYMDLNHVNNIVINDPFAVTVIRKCKTTLNKITGNL